MMKRRKGQTSRLPAPGEREYEFGIPIAGVVLPQEQWVKTAIKKLPMDGMLDLNEIFGRTAPTILDIGCGNGRYTIESGFVRPDINHIAIDLLPAVVRYGTRRANQRGLANVRFAVSDGWRMLSKYLGDNSLSEVHVYHPQPYADPKHASRRMLTPDFLVLMHQRLTMTGRVFLQTDRKSYWDYIQAVFSHLFDFREVDAWDAEPQIRSRREIIARKQGLKIYRGIATRRDDWSIEAIQEAAAKLALPTFSLDPDDE